MPKQTVPKLVNIADLKSTPRTPTLIHVTAEQWKQISKGATQARSLPKHQGFVEFIPLPDGDGIVHADCGAPSPDEVCSVRPVIDRPLPTPGPEPEPGPGPGPDPLLQVRPEELPLKWECRCRPKNKPGPETPLRPPCELVIDRGPRFRIRCNRITCTGRCRLTVVQVNGRFRLACVCS
jgi:hypothetical protein